MSFQLQILCHHKKMWSIPYTPSMLHNGRKYELERKNEAMEGQSIDRGTRRSGSWKKRTTSRESRYNPSKFCRKSSGEGKVGGGSTMWSSPSTSHATTWTRRFCCLERKRQRPLFPHSLQCLTPACKKKR